MAHDWPDVAEMLKTVHEFIDDVTPRLQGLDRYHALCAIYLLEIVERELQEWRGQVTPDDERLRALAGVDDAVGPAELTAALGRRIRHGDFDQRMDELLTALTAHVVAKVRVSKPSVLDEEHR